MRFAIPLSIAMAALIGDAVGSAATAADKDTPDKLRDRSSRACFIPSDVTSWKVVGDRDRLNVRVRQKDFYTAGLIGVCPNVDFAHVMALETYSSNFICEGDDAKLFVKGYGEHRDRCDLQKFRKMSPDEVAALVKDDKP